MNTYKKDTYESPFRIKRYLHQKRFIDALRVLNLKKHDLFLDYGCGDGYLLLMASKFIPPERLFGFEPAENMFQQAIERLTGTGITVVSNLDDLTYKTFTKISCLETCEHLSDEKLDELLKNISSLLDDYGELKVSVPIEIGFPALLKNTFRFAHNRHYDNLSLGNYVKTFLGLPVARNHSQKLENVEYIFSHIGFDYRKFPSQISNYLKTESRLCSPFPFLGPMLNNTIYYTCTKNP